MSEKQDGKHCVDYVDGDNEDQRSSGRLHKGIIQSAVKQSEGS